MPHRPGGMVAYRLLVRNEGRYRVFGSRTYGSLDAAHESVPAAVQSCQLAPESLLIQRGLELGLPKFDQHRIVPGQRGGWSDVDWETVEVIDGPLLHELHELPRPEFSTAASAANQPRSQRPAVLAGMATVAAATIGLFSMQANSGPPTNWIDARATAPVNTLPFDNAWANESNTPQPPARTQTAPAPNQPKPQRPANTAHKPAKRPPTGL